MLYKKCNCKDLHINPGDIAPDCFFIEEGSELFFYVPEDLLNSISEHLNIPKERFSIAENFSFSWEDQSKEHSPYYQQGLLKIPLQIFKKDCSFNLELKVGPGFGDLSHPSTFLMLKAMGKMNLKNKNVLDIGSGNGILSLAALAFGAKAALGIEIDKSAIKLSQKNASALEQNAKFIHTTELDQAYTLKSFSPKKFDVFFMNMIRTEQESAWETLPKSFQKTGKGIVSGFLKNERELFSQICKTRQWKSTEEYEKDDWLCFCIDKLS